MKPWYRSRLFWLGLLPLVFLLWAWWQSWVVSSELMYWGNNVFITNSNHRGQLILVFTKTTDNPPYPAGWRVDRSLLEVEDRPRVYIGPIGFAEAVSIRTSPVQMGTRTDFGVAHWLLASAYGGALIAAVLWRQRRKRKRATRTELE